MTQDFQGPMGIQECGVRQETPVHQVPLARPSEMEMGEEAYRVKWDPKAS